MAHESAKVYEIIDRAVGHNKKNGSTSEQVTSLRLATIS